MSATVESFLFMGANVHGLIVNILLLRWDIISWITGLLHYDAKQFINLLMFMGT